MQSLESLNLSLSALKSLLSDYALRSSQAEAMAGRLMVDKLSPEQFHQVLVTMKEHLDARSKERAVHQQAVIQATILSLESSARGDEATLRTTVNEVVKHLTLAQSHMNGPVRGSPGNPSQPSQTTTVNTENQTDKE